MASNEDNLLYQIGLNEARGIGPRLSKQLITHLGSARAAYESSPKELKELENITNNAIESLQAGDGLQRAEEELRWMEGKPVQTHFILDPSYPRRLRHCEDAPLVLYQWGDTDLNPQYSLGIVGTRAATELGQHFCDQFVHDLQVYNPLIVSGLAYGIDIAAQRGALQYGLTTVGVVAHGLDTVYPSLHRSAAREMEAAGGGLLTDFMHGTRPDRENFPMRNRIIAGMVDAVLVVEAGHKGGALITAELAHSYHRDVLAVPGRYNDPVSQGCNQLIKEHKASLVTRAKDLERLLLWKPMDHQPAAQTKLFAELNATQQTIYELLEKENQPVELEWLCYQLEISVSKALQELMTLELGGMVRALPGKKYCKN